MAQQLTFDPSEGPTQEQKDAEAQALAQGEKLQQAQQEDQEQQWDRTNKENENVDLIGGKFKSQEELLKAYQELEKQRGSETPEDATEDEPEAQQEPDQEESDEPSETDTVLNKAAEEYKEGGQLSEESIEELAKMDSKDLIKAYVNFYTKSAQARDLQTDQVTQIKNIAGGEEAHTEMMQWASQNLDPTEVDDFNRIADSGNFTALRFATEALYGRYKGDVGVEGQMVSGKASSSDGIKPYRSQAELARDIADPRYSTDPAFRSDIEERLSRTTDLF